MSPFYCCLAAAVLSLALALASASPAAASISVFAAAEPPADDRVPSPAEQFLRAHNEARRRWACRRWRGTRRSRWTRSGTPASSGRAGGAAGVGVGHRRRVRAEPVQGSGPRVRAGADASARWAEGARWYDRDGDSCAAPPGRCCGEYTQMVWRATTQIGCARRLCRCLGDTCPLELDTVAVCEYYPPGNIAGQRPY